MSRSIIIGSGPAAAATALALAEQPSNEILLVDIGTMLEADNDAARQRLAALSPAQWAESDRATIALQPVSRESGKLPEKRSYGSDYPFRNEGQLSGIIGRDGANGSVISGAFGGFSNVWGAQIMPFAAEDFNDWPLSRDDLEPHYRTVLSEIPFAGTHDDLATLFPLLGDPAPLPRLSQRTEFVLRDYERSRSALDAMGVIVGQARLAVQSSKCTPCSLCMTGCPYRLIYSAGQTLQRLIADGRVTHVSGMLATRVGESADGATVQATDLRSGTPRTFDGDRVYVACGAVGTTRVMLNSLPVPPQTVNLAESVQFLLPALSAQATEDPRDVAEFTLNQFNVVVRTHGREIGLSQIHFYPYNPAMWDALPGPLRHHLMEPAARSLMRRLSVGLGYLPSRFSPRVEVRAHHHGDGRLPDLTITGRRVSPARSAMFRSVARQLTRAARHLDLWPLLPMVSFSAPGKSYHWGGSFPHDPSGHLSTGTDLLGRPHGWERVHLVDASVFPSVAATTFTLTIMANAHRIAQASAGLA